MPSKQTTKNREASCQTLAQLSGETEFAITYRDAYWPQQGFVVSRIIAHDDDVTVSEPVYGPAPYRAVSAFLQGVSYARRKDGR